MSSSPPSKKPLAVLTMVRGDHHWARKWLAHYEPKVDARSDLYVIIHGQDPDLEEIFRGCSVLFAPLLDAGLENFERRRLDFQHFLIRGLQAYFHCVLLVDIDEFVVLAPPRSGRLADHLAEVHDGEMVRSALGFEVLHSEAGPALDLSQPVLSQRTEVYCNAQYSKPCAFYFNFGGATHHRVWGAPWIIDPDMLLFHLRYADRTLLEGYLTSRKAYYAEQETVAGTATSGSWRRPWKEFRSILAEVDARAPGALDDEMRMELRHKILDRFAKTNKVGKIASGRLTLPESYATLL